MKSAKIVILANLAQIGNRICRLGEICLKDHVYGARQTFGCVCYPATETPTSSTVLRGLIFCERKKDLPTVKYRP